MIKILGYYKGQKFPFYYYFQLDYLKINFLLIIMKFHCYFINLFIKFSYFRNLQLHFFLDYFDVPELMK